MCHARDKIFSFSLQIFIKNSNIQPMFNSWFFIIDQKMVLSVIFWKRRTNYFKSSIQNFRNQLWKFLNRLKRYFRCEFWFGFRRLDFVPAFPFNNSAMAARSCLTLSFWIHCKVAMRCSGIRSDKAILSNPDRVHWSQASPVTGLSLNTV